MRDKIFIDTNIWIYALTKPKNEIEEFKRVEALSLLQNIINSADIVISTQIVNELHFNLFKKFGIEDRKISSIIDENIVKISHIAPLCFLTYKKSYEIRANYNISFWDSLVISSAILNSCNIIYSEDMQDNLIIDKKLRILNPIKKVKRG